MAKTYSAAAVANALNISEQTVIDKVGDKPTLSDILNLDDNAKIKRFSDEAEVIRNLIAGVKALEK